MEISLSDQQLPLTLTPTKLLTLYESLSLIPIQLKIKRSLILKLPGAYDCEWTSDHAI